MKCKLLRIPAAFIFLFYTLLSIQCKDPVLQDTHILSDSTSGAVFTDTLTLITNTVREDSIKTTDLDQYLAGTIEDPVLGKAFASIYTQLHLTKNNLKFENNPVIDSVVLTMEYKGHYGDPSVPQTFIVYELGENMDPEAIYFSDQTFTLKEEIGRKVNFTANLEDSLNIDGNKFAPHLRIRLDNSFGQKILNASGSDNLADDEAFTNFIKGIYVAPSKANYGKAIYYFNMTSALTRIRIFYHNSDTNGVKADFLINEDVATVNHFQQDYSGSVVNDFLNNNENNDSVVFAQAMGGVKIKVEIPGIMDLAGNGDIIINKAELVLTRTTVPEDSSVFPPPDQMLTIKANSEGGNFFFGESSLSVLDQLVGSAYYGGNKLLESENGKLVERYRFNLARHFQEVVNGQQENRPLFLFPFPHFKIADRVILGGGASESNKMILNLYYTKIVD